MILKAMAMAFACTAAVASNAWAQTPESGAGGDSVATQAATDAAESRIPAKTLVEIEITEELSSKTSHIGDTFALKLAEPLILEGRTVLPAGVTGRGEVTHAASKGAGGKAGELIVNARYLECGALRIPLGYFQHGVAGKNNVGGAFATAQIIPFGQFLVSGHDAVIPAGARGTARIKTEVIVPAQSVGRCPSPAPAPAE